tara:strand:- start:2866 stop:4002 length:1137 start_codon:yes stop_codon:yes gene_type:complete
MGLLDNTTAEQYYRISQEFTTNASQASTGIYDLTVTRLPAAETDFIIYVNGTEINRDTYGYTATGSNPGRITITSNLPAVGATVLVEFIDRSLGDYRYVTLASIVNNFMYGYTGNGKVLNNVNRNEVLFHAKRGIQEFSYEVSRVEKIQEVDVGADLTVAMPQDYVNYVRLSWVDDAGVEHPIFPARYTSRASQSVAQDQDSTYLYDDAGEVLEIRPSVGETRFTNEFELDNFSGRSNNNDDYYLFSHYISNIYHKASARYGLNPENVNYNGVFVVDEANGQFGFDSSMAFRTIHLKYISDGLGTDGEMKIHKLAEDAIYKYIYHAVISTMLNIPEYQIMRAKRERRAAMRNAKLRLSNIKLHELTQVMRGKSKILKH